jgi:hypothetical protein
MVARLTQLIFDEKAIGVVSLTHLVAPSMKPNGQSN